LKQRNSVTGSTALPSNPATLGRNCDYRHNETLNMDVTSSSHSIYSTVFVIALVQQNLCLINSL